MLLTIWLLGSIIPFAFFVGTAYWLKSRPQADAYVTPMQIQGELFFNKWNERAGEIPRHRIMLLTVLYSFFPLVNILLSARIFGAVSWYITRNLTSTVYKKATFLHSTGNWLNQSISSH